MTVEYVTLMEAARRCGVSDKTIRRWIHAGKLPARLPTNSTHYEIALCDLEPFFPEPLPGQNAPTLEDRVTALERQVLVLEQQIQQLLTRPGTEREPHTPLRKRHATTGPLPRQWVSVLAFAELHRIPEQKVQAHIEINLLSVHKGTWTDQDGQVVTLAFDAKGRQAFHHLYHETAWFVPCSRCPHALPGHV